MKTSTLMPRRPDCLSGSESSSAVPGTSGHVQFPVNTLLQLFLSRFVNGRGVRDGCELTVRLESLALIGLLIYQGPGKSRLASKS